MKKIYVCFWSSVTNSYRNAEIHIERFYLLQLGLIGSVYEWAIQHMNKEYYIRPEEMESGMSRETKMNILQERVNIVMMYDIDKYHSNSL
jgi:hypothetical protein